MLDLTKSYRTRDGRSVEKLVGDTGLIAGLLEGVATIWRPDGKHDAAPNLDLVDDAAAPDPPRSTDELRALCEAAPDHMLRNGSDQDNARRFYNSVRTALPDLLDKADRLDAIEARSAEIRNEALEKSRIHDPRPRPPPVLLHPPDRLVLRRVAAGGAVQDREARERETEGMICTLIEDRKVPGQFRVEAIDKDGGCEVAIFSGPNALERAIHFAAVDGKPYYDGWADPEDHMRGGEHL